MNRLPSLILGIIAAFAVSWFGVVAYSYMALGRLEPNVDASSGDIAPPPLPGLAPAGQRVYAANGCVTCHSQQVRSGTTDVEKKLGPRPTVARDYLRENPAPLGRFRIGPDLANIGLRITDANELHRHLFEPTAVTRGSNMPSYRYLYEVRKITGQPSALALQGLTGPYAPEPGYEVVPTDEARALVVYLLSLKRNYTLPEAEPLQ